MLWALSEEGPIKNSGFTQIFQNYKYDEIIFYNKILEKNN